MLTVTIPGSEFYDEVHNEFITTNPQTIQLEHSLVSISKWESKWRKPFLTKDTRTQEETIDYIRCMTLTQNVDPKIYLAIPNNVIKQIAEYIDSPMTATTFKDEKGGRRNREIVTSELIYYWMISNEIPFECQKWHLNRLLTLIKVCSIKNNAGNKKMSRKDIYSQNRALNSARKARLGSAG